MEAYGGVFKQIVSTFSKPDIDLFASRINHQLSNYISWRPDLGAKAVNAFSIKWSPTYSYCFPPFSIILKVLQKVQQESYGRGIVLDHTEPVPGTLRNAARLLSNNDSLIEHTVSPYPPNITSPSASQVQVSSSSHIWGNIEPQNVSTTTQYILLSSWGKPTRAGANLGYVESVGLTNLFFF